MSKAHIQFYYANPVMPVRNAKATANYYKEKLGFNIDVLWKDPNYACVSRGGITIEFGEGRPEHIGSGVCVIQVSNVNYLYEEFVEKGIKIEGDFKERDYGDKDFRLRDSDGNLLIFGSQLVNKIELIQIRNVASQ